MYVCVSMCTLREVPEEDLGGTRNDVCSSAAELGHGKVERERESKERQKENSDSF